MIKNKSIRLGRGFSDIQFGASKDEIEKIMGEPDGIESIANEDSEFGESHVWHYDDASVSFTFDEMEGFRMGLISVSNDQYILRDLIRIGMRKQQVLDALEELTFLDYAEEDHSNAENPDHTLVAVDEKSLYLWFDNDTLNEIQWFPYYDDEEEIIWPS